MGRRFRNETPSHGSRVVRPAAPLEVCLSAREKEGAQNPRVSGEVADKAFRAASKALSLASDIDDQRCKGLPYLSCFSWFGLCLFLVTHRAERCKRLHVSTVARLRQTIVDC